MIRPRKMKRVEIFALEKDVDTVVGYLGRGALMQFSQPEGETAALKSGAGEGVHSDVMTRSGHIAEKTEEIREAAVYLGLELPIEPYAESNLPSSADEELADTVCARVLGLRERENTEKNEKQKLETALTESRAFSALNAPFSELDSLSYLTLRVGRLDARGRSDLKKDLADRVVIVPLDNDRVLAASSRAGRFALDAELKKQSFTPISIPKDYQGIPEELVSGLETRLAQTNKALSAIAEEKEKLLRDYSMPLLSLSASYLMADITERVKEKLVATKNVYLLTGWVPADALKNLVADLVRLTSGRVSVRTLNPEEVPSVLDGAEKVPTDLKHGRFARSFEPLVFSYGAPLYGSIDPTGFVAVFFTILFGVMFGDVGQGFVLMLVGLLLSQKKAKFLSSYRNFGGPMIAVGVFSIFMGLLYGSVFSNEEILEAPTHAVTAFLSQTPIGEFFGWQATGKILHLMPSSGNIDKLFYFFGFTLALGVILNSTGLVFNIINKANQKKYEEAFFSKTGLAGAFFFWYVVILAVRIILKGSLYWFDIPCIAVPLFCIFFGKVLWRLIAGERPVMQEGLMVFIIEGIVELLETLSSYISNSVSFLRVGAFALSHAVLSFITFTMADIVAGSSAFGPLFSLIIVLFGNAIIIVLEGMIVAIQVTRLQYYEFFSKFFTETGVRFEPFRFRKE